MPGRSCARRLLLLLGTSALAACSGGGGGGSGATDDVPSGGGGTRSATLAWAKASGPVTGYRVYVSRNGQSFAAEANVKSPSVTISGVTGERFRLRVAARDSKGDVGPLSPPSIEILFTESGATAAGAGTASAPVAESSAGASGSSRSAVPSASTAKTPEESAELPPRGGDGVSELLWEAIAPATGMRLTSLWNGALHTELAFERPSGWRIAGNDDFDGDGRADLLWESGAGELAISTRAALDASAPTTPLSPLHALDPDEIVIATGDLDGDGLADLLVQDDATGSRSVWLMNPDAAPDVAALGADVPPQSSLAATGDFDGDGRTDLLWRAPDGALSIHFMAGAVSYGSLALPADAAPEALATGDFDGDGDDDLVRRDAAGAMSVLLMGERQTPAPWSVAVDAGAGSQVAGAGDFDGDAAADLVWVSASGVLLGFYTGVAAEYVAIAPGDGWQLVSFAP